MRRLGEARREQGDVPLARQRQRHEGAVDAAALKDAERDIADEHVGHDALERGPERADGVVHGADVRPPPRLPKPYAPPLSRLVDENRAGRDLLDTLDEA